jgi:hypothetical protein
MKRILAPILLLTFLFPSLAYGETMNDLVKRNYKKFTDVPFTGRVTGKTQGSLKNGKWDGPWVNYFDHGQISYKGNYKDGKADGPWVSYYRNGTVDPRFTGTYKNGVKVN